MANVKKLARNPARLRRPELIAEVRRLEAELSEAQAALRSYEHLISQVYHHSKVRCWTWDAESQRVKHIIPKEDVKGRELPVIPVVDDYLKQVHPDDHSRVARAYEQADREGTPIDVE